MLSHSTLINLFPLSFSNLSHIILLTLCSSGLFFLSGTQWETQKAKYKIPRPRNLGLAFLSFLITLILGSAVIEYIETGYVVVVNGDIYGSNRDVFLVGINDI